jgi:hypothetical protein
MPCSECHVTDSWSVLSPAMKFDHQSTRYPLTGRHRDVSCRSCHVTLHFVDTPHECVSCHAKDYADAVAINHRKAGYGRQCETCHDQDALTWQSGFDHDRTQFPTRGIHETVPCVSCHTGGRYRGTPITCVSCHLTQYIATSSPNHATSKFGTDCAVCHRALTWAPASFFPHSYFPIAKGDRHSPGVWNSCIDCHPSQPTYTSYDCTGACHHHPKSQMDSRHSGVSGYASTKCYQCHSNP